jgi:hypothetical protein
MKNKIEEVFEVNDADAQEFISIFRNIQKKYDIHFYIKHISDPNNIRLCFNFISKNMLINVQLWQLGGHNEYTLFITQYIQEREISIIWEDKIGSARKYKIEDFEKFEKQTGETKQKIDLRFGLLNDIRPNSFESLFDLLVKDYIDKKMQTDEITKLKIELAELEVCFFYKGYYDEGFLTKRKLLIQQIKQLEAQK